MTNTSHYIDPVSQTRHNIMQRTNTTRLERRITDLEKRIEELERAFYEKVDHPGIDRTEVWPIQLATEYQQKQT